MIKSINISIFNETVPYETIFDTVQKAGFGGVELNLFNQKQAYPSLWTGAEKNELLSVKSLAEKFGLKIAGVVSAELWSKQLSSDNQDERNGGIEILKILINAASVLGSDSVLVVPGVAGPEMKYQTVIDNARSSIRQALPLAESLGVVLGIENVWNKFFISPFEILSFINSFESDFVKSYLDVGNMCMWSYPQHWIEILAGKIHRVHVKGFNTKDNTFCMLHDGTMDWTAIMKAFREAGYDGFITSELWSENDIPAAVRAISADIDKILIS